MSIVLKTLIQGSDDWVNEKLGKPSASHADEIITTKGEPSKQSEGYLYSLAAEIITGQKAETFKSEAMEEGIRREQESRDFYSLITGNDVEKVGVIYKDENKKFLCSPDGIIGENIGLELKNVLPKTQVKYLLKGDLPPEYFSQVQFSLYVSGFKEWHFFSYSPGLKPLFIKVLPDKEFISKLEIRLIDFCNKLEQTVKELK